MTKTDKGLHLWNTEETSRSEGTLKEKWGRKLGLQSAQTCAQNPQKKPDPASTTVPGRLGQEDKDSLARKPS